MSRFSEDSHELGLKIGACPPDAAKYEVPYQMLTPSNGLLVRRGTIALQTSGTINHWQSGSGTAAVQLPESGAENAVVVINGFRIRSRALDSIAKHRTILDRFENCIRSAPPQKAERPA